MSFIGYTKYAICVLLLTWIILCFVMGIDLAFDYTTISYLLIFMVTAVFLKIMILAQCSENGETRTVIQVR